MMTTPTLHPAFDDNGDPIPEECPPVEDGGCMPAGVPPRHTDLAHAHDTPTVAFRKLPRLCVYVSGPMTGDGTPLAMQVNVLNGVEIFKDLLRKGFAVFLPHLTGLMPGHEEIAHDDWIANDLPWVARADAVLRLYGDSPGADTEVVHAAQHGVPVFTTVDQLVRWRDAR